MLKQLTFRRFELKYQIPRNFADRLIPEILKYMEWDKYVGDEEFYHVNSIYVDSADFCAYHDKLDGLLNRKKLRIRSYSDFFDINKDLFFEIKRKSGQVILKDRILLDGIRFQSFLDNPFSLLASESSEFVEEFLFEYTRKRMRPVVLIKYKRKPFYAKFNKSFRLTFDYDMSFSEVSKFNFNNDDTKKIDDMVIMEAKFNGALPRWFHDIVEDYGLKNDTFSKYCSAIEALKGLPAYY